MRRKDEHRFGHGGGQPADRVEKGSGPLALALLHEDVAAFSVLQRNVEVHARAGIALDRLGHEAGGDAMPARLRPDQPLQHDQVVGRLQHVAAVMERQLVLTWRIFRNHRLGRNALRAGGRVDVGEKRLHAVQVVDGIDFGLGAPASVEHGARRLDTALAVAVVGQQEEFELEGAGREKAPCGQRPDLADQGVARVRRHRRAVEPVHRHENLAARRLRAMERLQRAWYRPGRADRRRRNPRSGRSRARPRRLCRDRGSRSADAGRPRRDRQARGGG